MSSLHILRRGSTYLAIVCLSFGGHDDFRRQIGRSADSTPRSTVELLMLHQKATLEGMPLGPPSFSQSGQRTHSFLDLVMQVDKTDKHRHGNQELH